MAVSELAGVKIPKDALQIEILQMPHQPGNLPKGKMAVYVFSDKDSVLKVGKAGQNSNARYKSQHYNPGSSQSNLAASLLKDEEVIQRYSLNRENVPAWIKQNTDRVNFLLDANLGTWILTLLEAFTQCRLQPVFEGHVRQRRS